MSNPPAPAAPAGVQGVLTPTVTKRTSLLVLLSMFFAMLIPAVAASPAQAVTTPTIASDKEDYAPGEQVTLTGAGWQDGESVHINVDDDQTKTWTRDVDVVANSAGSIKDVFNLPDWFVATYKVTATGAVSGTATTGFTDGNVRFITSGPDISGVSWAKFSTTDCSGNAAVSGSDATLKSSAGNTFGIGIGQNESARVTAPSTAGTPTQNFSAWSAKNGSDPFTTSGSGSRTICVRGFDQGSARDYQATYGAVTATTVSDVAATASVYGGTTGLSAKVAPVGVAGSVSFYLNGSTTAVASTYDATTGTATVANHAHGLAASSTAYSLKAVFAPTNTTTHSGSDATTASALTVNKATATLTLGSLSQTWNGQANAATVTTSPADLSGVSISYKQGETAVASPTNVGSYAVGNAEQRQLPGQSGHGHPGHRQGLRDAHAGRAVADLRRAGQARHRDDQPGWPEHRDGDLRPERSVGPQPDERWQLRRHRDSEPPGIPGPGDGHAGDREGARDSAPERPDAHL